MTRLVTIGQGRMTHPRADGSGPVPEGRSRCELSADGKYDPYLQHGGDSVSPTHDAGEGRPTCKWCRTRDLA